MFHLNEQIQSSCFYLGDWSLSKVFLKNDCNIPWFILVPKRANIQEIYQLSRVDQTLLMQEMNELSLLVKQFYQPKKLNIASLGNVVAQLHIHCVARFENDLLWPQGIWQSSYCSASYSIEQLDKLLPQLKHLTNQSECAITA